VVRHGYAGQWHDTETGFIYLRARYYDPTTGQFLTRDPITPLTRSPYGYVYGNPLNNSDPSGLYCVTGVAGHESDGKEICNGVSEVVQNVVQVATAPVAAPINAVLQQQAPSCDPASPQCINRGINQLQEAGSHLKVTGLSGCLVIWCRNGTFAAKNGLTYQDAWGLALMFQVVGFNYVSKPSSEWNGRVWCVSVALFQGCRARDGNWSCGGALGLGLGVYTYEN
jgi:RHS repeat-associated protein